MQTTRQRILDFLAARGTTTTRQLAQAFGMSAQNVRRHLEILQARDLVVALDPQPAEGRGRPEFSYALTSSAQPNNLAGLTSALLEGLSAGDLRREPAQRLRRLGRRLAGDAVKPSEQTSQRLVGTVRRLTPLGYRPRWEARPNRPEVVFGHCPYAAIIGQHPELCQMDASILEDMLGAPVEQLSKLQPGPQGTPQCVFRIKQAKTA